MHYEILIEDQSGKAAMEILFPKFFSDDVTYRIHPYRGIGRLPKGLNAKSDPSKRILLDQLPRLLRGYGKTPNSGTVVVICDLDDKNKQEFLSELSDVLNACMPRPEITLFCLAIEEIEAWYLGDLDAVRIAYPKAKSNILSSYKNDSICGTWELLADAIYKGGHKTLQKKGWQAVGEQKSIWANTIAPHMIIENNKSPSFNYMKEQIQTTNTQ